MRVQVQPLHQLEAFLSGRVAEDFPDMGQADAVPTVSYMRQLKFTSLSYLNSSTDRFVFMSFQQDEDSLGKCCW